jgi:hypothetical protein
MIHPITYIDPETTSLNDFFKESVFNIDMQQFKSDSMFYNKIGNYAFAKRGLKLSSVGCCVNERTIETNWLEITTRNKRFMEIIENVLIAEYIKLFRKLAPKKQLTARYRGKRLIKLSTGK